MPTGNRPEFAAQAIRCFQAQDYPHRELIVVDSGTPGLSRLADRDARIKYVNVVGSSPMSIGAKRNLACREAQGDILICWDDDDWYGPSRISKQTAPLVHGQCDLTGVTQFLVLELMSGLLWRPSRKALRSLFSTIVCGTAAFRREVLRRTCFPDVSMGEDVAFVRVAVNSRARLLPVAAGGDFVYVRHGKNTWSNDAWYRQAGSTIVKDSPWGPAEQRFYDSLRHATAA